MRRTRARLGCRILSTLLRLRIAGIGGQSPGRMKNETPAEPFKRAVASAVRSLAGEPHLEINYSAEPPTLKGLKARLPLPSRNLPPSEVAVVRGQGDAFALRLA